MRELKGRVAVVTGAGSGIGKGLAERFAAEGMKVVLADVNERRLDETRRKLAADGTAVLAVPTDVSQQDDVDRLARAALNEFGGVQLVCNNAGIGGAAMKMVWEMTPEDWNRIIGVNLLGVANGLRSFVPILLEQEEAHIVNTASIAGLTAGLLGAYSVTKHAVVALTESLYFGLLFRGITHVGVSALCPGWVRTKLRESIEEIPGNPLSDAMKGQLEAGMEPSELAGIVVEAIRAQRFYILSDPELNGAIEIRTADVLEGRPPSLITPSAAPVGRT
jgi:NAD(P)-dependent dehydrogenase (short-subunit alcohol dehydrogenase family)